MQVDNAASNNNPGEWMRAQAAATMTSPIELGDKKRVNINGQAILD